MTKEVPDKITIPWMFKYFKIRHWLSLSAIVIAAMFIGLNLSRIAVV